MFSSSFYITFGNLFKEKRSLAIYGKMHNMWRKNSRIVSWKNQRYNYVTNNIYDNDIILPPNQDFADIFDAEEEEGEHDETW